MTEHGAVYAVVVKMYEYGTHLDSVHRTREKAEYRVKEIDGTDIPEGYYYDNFEVAIWEVPLK